MAQARARIEFLDQLHGALDEFHPAVASWFLKTFPAPTDAPIEMKMIA